MIDTFLVLNGDLLTDLDYASMLAQHRDTGATLTIGLYERTHTVDFGVVETNDAQMISGYTEKPSFQYHVSMGVCVMEPAVLDLISAGEHLDLPDLVHRMLRKSTSDRIHSARQVGATLEALRDGRSDARLPA